MPEVTTRCWRTSRSWADGRCERCGTPVDRARPGAVVLQDHGLRRRAAGLLADRLARARRDDAEQLDRPLRGRRVRASRSRAGRDTIAVFTTRPDTVFGITFVVLAPEHPLVDAADHARAARGRARVPWSRRAGRARSSAQSTRQGEDRRLHRAPTPSTRSTASACPIWIADYVLMTYGTGAIMAVPAHDERDFEFAKKFGLPDQPGGSAAGLGRRRPGRAATPARA